MSFFSNLLGTDGVVESVRDGVDKSILTPEERLDYHKELLKAYEPFKIIQRYLALATTAMFGFIVLIEVILTIIGGWYPKATEVVSTLNTLDNVNYIGMAFVAVMSLYFSGGIINTFKK